ncbi:MAG: SRPBCC domain-containing protein [Actinomycetota bacterium]
MMTQDLAPVVQTVEVDCSLEVAFKTFTEGIGSWWPLDTHSIGEDKIDKMVFEERAGGRVYEIWQDGHEEPWADILVWEPPRRFVLAWHPNPEATVSTEVEVSFEETDRATMVRLEHRNWEVLGDAAAQVRLNYDTDWPKVLDRLRSATA